MKNSKLLILSSLIFSLTACGGPTKPSVEDSTKESVSETASENPSPSDTESASETVSESESTSTHVHVDEDHDHVCDDCEETYSTCLDENGNNFCDICGKQMEETDYPYTGRYVDDGKFVGYDFVKKGASEKAKTGTVDVKICTFNDFHGAVKADGYESGLIKVASYFKKETSNANTLVFDNGDTWQGSFESNYRKGSIIQRALACANVSGRTIGNHDFDWGVEQLQNSAALNYNKYTIPTMASNAYEFDWEQKRVTDKHLDDVGCEYLTYTLDSGVKVGVVGVIGTDQITSIATQFVKNVTFIDPIATVKKVSDYLRTEKDCDIIVASTHCPKAQTLEFGLGDTSPVSGKRYTDLVLNAHSHAGEYSIENGVMHTQFTSNGKQVGYVNLHYDLATGTCADTVSGDRRYNNSSWLNNTNNLTDDSTISSMVNSYLNEIAPIGTETVHPNFTGSWAIDAELPNLMAEAVYKEAKAEGYNIDLSVVNKARDPFSDSSMSYSSLFKSFPFDNQVIIMKTRGYNSVGTIASFRSYHEGTTQMSINKNNTYTIAALDYLALHTDADRKYDFFDNTEEIGVLKDGDTVLTYRDVLYRYLKANQNKAFDSSNYSNSLGQFSARY